MMMRCRRYAGVVAGHRTSDYAGIGGRRRCRARLGMAAVTVQSSPGEAKARGRPSPLDEAGDDG